MHFCKIFDGRICEDDNGQSFNIYFKIIAKKIYPEIEESYLDNIIQNLNCIIIGDAEKNTDTEIWDYRNCKIKPIPNFDDSINEFYYSDTFESDKKIYTYDHNWFNTLQNKLYNVSKSESFKLTVAKLNCMKIDIVESSSNNFINFDNHNIKDINLMAEKVVDINIFQIIINWISSFFTHIFYY